MLADPIAELRSPSGSLISVYLGRPSPGGMTALLTDLLRPVREAAESKDRSVQSRCGGFERIHDQAELWEVDAAPAYAIFASDLDGLFTSSRWVTMCPTCRRWGPAPICDPCERRPRRCGRRRVADRSQARVFVASGRLIDEVGSPLIADIGKPNYGGFSGYQEHGVRLRADEVSTRMWREAGAILLEKHQQRPFDYLAIGGHGEIVEEIGRTLHPYLDRVDRATFHAGPQSLSFPALRRAGVSCRK